MNRHEAREAALGLVFEKAFKPLEETDKLYELAKLERELVENFKDYIEKNKKIVDEFYKFQDQQLDKKIEIQNI